MKQKPEKAREEDYELRGLFIELSRCTSPFTGILYDVAVRLAAQLEHDGNAEDPTERQATEHLFNIWQDAVSESPYLSDALQQVADLLVRQTDIRDFFRKKAKQLEIRPTMVTTEYLLSRAR